MLKNLKVLGSIAQSAWKKKNSLLNTDGNKSILRTFSNMQKYLWKTLHQGDNFKSATTDFFSKIPNRKKIFNEKLSLCEAKCEIIKSIYSQRNNESPGNSRCPYSGISLSLF